jgi:hypothetical protein
VTLVEGVDARGQHANRQGERAGRGDEPPPAQQNAEIVGQGPGLEQDFDAAEAQRVLGGGNRGIAPILVNEPDAFGTFLLEDVVRQSPGLCWIMPPSTMTVVAVM